MNIIDIIILSCLVISAIWGFKDGAIRQIGTLVGVIVAVILAKKLGADVASTLGIGGSHPNIWGYIIVLVVSLVAVIFLAFVLRKAISAVGLGIVDRLAGAFISLVKWSLILSVLFALFNLVNSAFGIVDNNAFEESTFYKPVCSTSQYIVPTLNWVGEQIPHENSDDDE